MAQRLLTIEGQVFRFEAGAWERINELGKFSLVK
jgi:hypothetical protein